MQNPINFFWFRRDLRLEDNAGLYHALKSGLPVCTLFIFDTDILDKIEDKQDRRLVFIHAHLEKLNVELNNFGSTLLVKIGKPIDVWKKIILDYSINDVYTNHDYEPYAKERDETILKLLQKNKIGFHTYKDQVIFEKDDVIKDDGTPYTVFTPYMNKWKKTINESHLKSYNTKKYFQNFSKINFQPVPDLKKIGFKKIVFDFPGNSPDKSLLKKYSDVRDIPSIAGTSRIGIHLRFGTVSIRNMFNISWDVSEKWVNELIWREFYMMILWHFPHVTEKAFKPKYNFLPWLNNEVDFQKWCDGKTGYPIVDAGMRELNETGFMHNRVRMITAMFLTKYLLIDWRWGEAYFAKKLLDYELASNNGGWQWSAGTGVDAAPYFRIFNMYEQTKKFDPKMEYIKKWVPEFQELTYPAPIVEYTLARKRCLEFYKKAGI